MKLLFILALLIGFPTILVVVVRRFLSANNSAVGTKIFRYAVTVLSMLMVTQIIAAIFFQWYLLGYKTFTFFWILTTYSVLLYYLFVPYQKRGQVIAKDGGSKMLRAIGLVIWVSISLGFSFTSLYEYSSNILFEDNKVRVEETWDSLTERLILPTLYVKNGLFEKVISLDHKGDFWSDFDKSEVKTVHYQQVEDYYEVIFILKDGRIAEATSK